MLAAQEARHGCSAKGSGRRKGRTRYFGFVTQAVGQHFGFCVSFCHSFYFTLAGRPQYCLVNLT